MTDAFVVHERVGLALAPVLSVPQIGVAYRVTRRERLTVRQLAQ